VIIGGPGQVIEGMMMRKQLGYDGVLVDMAYHLREHQAVLRSLRFMRDEVMPAVMK
jgi:alkanesulfonate monooxygenase SsuD/methylene tetrahydromethanopterin reductase-like flavin-dependent oxidoreductase (luciferase family)